MRRAVVTGVAGFVGAHVARALLADGWSVTGVVRRRGQVPDGPPDGVDPVVGDLRDPATMRRAIVGADAVFHVAATYSLSRRRGRALAAENRSSTREVIAACRRRDLPLVHTSSVATIGMPPPPVLGNELTPLRADVAGAYKRSKLAAEREVLRAAAGGMHVVVVNPTAPVGPGDRRPTPTGRLIRDAALGRMPATVDTGLNVVHVEDVARGHALALEHGQSGRRYILGGDNLTLHSIVSIAGAVSGRRPPWVRLPHSVAIGVAAVDEVVEGWLLGREPAAPLDGAMMARARMWVSDERARAELGHRPRSAAEAIAEAARWFIGRDAPAQVAVTT